MALAIFCNHTVQILIAKVGTPIETCFGDSFYYLNNQEKH